MTRDRDIDTPPASEDSVVQNYLDTNWRESVRATRESMQCLRNLHPEMVNHLPETAADKLHYALGELEKALGHLHGAGPLVIGRVAYDEYLETQTTRQIES